MKKVLCLMLALSMLLVFASCGSNDSLIMATNAEFPPFEYVTGADQGVVGEFDGIDVRIAKEIADKMGKELEVTNIAFDSIIPALLSGKADMGIAGMSVTEERKQNVDFSEPYWVAVQTILVNKDNTDITDAMSLVGKTVGVVNGYTGDLAISEVEGVNIKRYQKGVDIVLDVKNGKLDAGIIDSPTAKSFLEKNPDLKGVTDDSFFETEEYAIAVKKGNTELLDAINEVIAELKENGRIDEISAEVDALLQ